MPRKPLLYVSDFPYHVIARANNRDWFYISKQRLFELFIKELQIIKEKFGARIHAFVLMDNHYHLILSTTEEYNLGMVMQLLQKSISRAVNKEAGRINHVFGGPYKGSLITNPNHYAHVLKYLYRNPVKAEMVDRVEDYTYSTLGTCFEALIESVVNGMDIHIPTEKEKLLEWLNTPHTASQNLFIRNGLRRTKFNLAAISEQQFEAT